MSGKTFFVFLSLVLATTTSCSVNILEEFGDPDTDRAKFVDAEDAINESAWDTAITLITSMSAEYQTREDVIELHASAYAGRCGFDFLTFGNTTLANMGTARLLLYLMQNRNGATTTVQSDCQQAIDLIEGIDATAANRTDDQNVFMAVLALFQVGNIINIYGDTNDDGTADWNGAVPNDACEIAAISDADVGQIGASLVRAITSISALSSQTVGGDQLTEINSVCTSLASPPVSDADICTKTDPNSFDANELTAFRTLLRENSSIGTGSCAGDVTACLCP